MGGLLGAFADRYHIEREVGHGAMARVYLARDVLLNRDVAVKKLNPELSAALGQERFLREIDILTHLNHPHILPLLDKAEADGLLCYVMPFIPVGSLRERLRRETQLPIADAIAITRDVARALDYAHRQGIVHRDIKPENILMSEGLALVADFGIARAITLAAGDDDRITQTGVSPGTPPYMSPEQASNGEVDGRSDIYALGCVLYEMLAGQPPFLGPTTQAILARHLADPVPPLRTVRKTVSEGLEQVVLKSLEKVPADRFATAGEFAEALVVPSVAEAAGSHWVKLGIQIAAAMAVAAVILLSLRAGATPGPGESDSTRYAILPIERAEGIPSSNDDQLLEDAFGHWTGIEVVDPFQVKDAMTRLQGRSLTSEDVRSVASGLGAGRYVRTELTRVGDSVRVHAELYDANRRTRLRDATVRLGRNSTQPVSRFGTLVDRLLFGNAGPGAGLDGYTGTHSFPARTAFARGLDATYAWNLLAADSAFKAATEFDPDFSPAHLWLAQVRFWKDTVPATWRSSAERAAGGRIRLSSRDQLLSDALLAFGRGDPVSACRTWKDLTAREQYDFTGWYGLATCLTRDDAVIRDPRSPSGWGFRTSFYRATKAYERAFQLLPSVHQALSAGSYAGVRRLLRTSGGAVRQGSSEGGVAPSFSAHPSWLGDTLAFVPFPNRQARDQEFVAGVAAAVHHERELFRDIAVAWVSAFPKSPEALEALAISYDLLENPAAIETIRRARGLAQTDEQRVRLAGTEAWMRVKLSVPSDKDGLTRARALIDSLLLQAPETNAVQPLLLASLAAVTGRARLAAAFAGTPRAAVDFDAPGVFARNGLPLLVFAAFGGPLDSLRTLEQQVEAAIDQHVVAAEWPETRTTWLVRPARLAFPDYQFASWAKLVPLDDYLLGAEAALLRGDTASVLRTFAGIREARRDAPPSDVYFESLYPEARLLLAVRDSQAAIAWLDGTLRALPATDPQGFVNPANAAAFVRTMALRSDLAKEVGDRAAEKRWASAVAVLWSDCDQFLQPLLHRMRQTAGSS